MAPGKFPGTPWWPRRRPWAAGREAGASGGSPWGSGIPPPGDGFSPPGGRRGGDHASCAKWLETYRKWLFSRGSRPGPPAGIPAHLEHADWLHWVRFRVLLRATLLPDGCPVGVRRQVWTGQGGLKPPCIVTFSMLQPRIVTMRDCTSARSRVSGRVGSGHAARVNLGLLSRRSC